MAASVTQGQTANAGSHRTTGYPGPRHWLQHLQGLQRPAIIPRAIQITPVSTCQTRLSQRHSCCFLPAFRLLKTLLEPREAAVPCKPGGKIAQACFCLSVTRHVLPACDPSSWRTNARQGSLQVPPRPTISRDDPLPSGQRRCNRPDNNVRAHLAGRATATDGDQPASQSARQPDSLTAQSRYSLARAVGGSPHRWVEHAASFLLFFSRLISFILVSVSCLLPLDRRLDNRLEIETGCRCSSQPLKRPLTSTVG